MCVAGLLYVHEAVFPVCARVHLAPQAHAPAVFVDKTTKVVCQGITGKNGTFHTEQVRGQRVRGCHGPIPASSVGSCCISVAHRVQPWAGWRQAIGACAREGHGIDAACSGDAGSGDAGQPRVHLHQP